MKQSHSSDDEFWNEVEAPLQLKVPTKNYRCNDFFQTVTRRIVSIKPSGNQNKLITNVRLSKEIELKQQKILVRKQTIREVQFNTDEIKSKYESEVAVIIKENQELKDKYIELRKKLFNSAANCREQEFLLTLNKISQRSKPQPVVQENIYEDDMKAVKIQVKLLKEVCGCYVKDIEALNSKVKELEMMVEHMANEHIRVVNEMKLAREASEKVLEDKIKLGKEELNRLKEDIKVEINLQGVINRKQTETIAVLKEELKKAQYVVQTPRLRYRTIEKVASLAEKSVETDRAYRQKSILPLISSEKEMFNSTMIHLSKYSSKFLEVQGSRKQINNNL